MKARASSKWPLYHTQMTNPLNWHWVAQQRPVITHQSSSWCTTLNLFGTFVVHQTYRGGRHVQRACFWIFATACFPRDGWPHCFKRPGSLRLPTCRVDTLLLCFDGHYYQYYSAGRYKSFQPADCLLPPTTVHWQYRFFATMGKKWWQLSYTVQIYIAAPDYRLLETLPFFLFVLGKFLLYIFCETQWCI